MIFLTKHVLNVVDVYKRYISFIVIVVYFQLSISLDKHCVVL